MSEQEGAAASAKDGLDLSSNVASIEIPAQALRDVLGGWPPDVVVVGSHFTRPFYVGFYIKCEGWNKEPWPSDGSPRQAILKRGKGVAQAAWAFELEPLPSVLLSANGNRPASPPRH